MLSSSGFGIGGAPGFEVWGLVCKALGCRAVVLSFGA